MGYRKDIDGLRCVAVTAVVLYHFGLSAPGGFVGVDVFFVISGYLITAQIAGDIEAQRFSLLTFYARRCKRILPALLVVCTACLLAGWFVLWPGDYKALAASVRYAAFGLANFYFLWNTGYFDQASDLLPMLHLWSLGVEEQFYFAWPALLLLALPLGRRWLIALLLALIAISLGASINAVAADQKAAFYLPHLRAWELAIGGLLVFLPHMRLPSYAREILGAAAALLILGAIVMLTKASPFPGLSALPPVIGAALLIWHTMHGGSSAVSRLLSLAPAVFVGKISYSLYLWHWPVLVLFRHINKRRYAEPAGKHRARRRIGSSVDGNLDMHRATRAPPEAAERRGRRRIRGRHASAADGGDHGQEQPGLPAALAIRGPGVPQSRCHVVLGVSGAGCAAWRRPPIVHVRRRLGQRAHPRVPMGRQSCGTSSAAASRHVSAIPRPRYRLRAL